MNSRNLLEINILADQHCLYMVYTHAPMNLAAIAGRGPKVYLLSREGDDQPHLDQGQSRSLFGTDAFIT